MELLIKYIIAFIIATLSTYTDVRHGKIKNISPLILIISSIIISIVFLDINFKDKIYGLIIPFVLGFPLYAVRMFGAGDVKLFCGLGALFGLEWILWCMAFSIFCGGAIALFIIIKSKNAKERLLYLFSYLKFTLLTMKFTTYQNFDKKSSGTFPFAIAILLGCFVSAIVEFI